MSAFIRGKKVLWVEDRVDMLRDEIDALNRAGAIVSHAVTANQAYDMLLVDDYDVAILDLILPQQEPLRDELKLAGREAGLPPRSELRGLIIAWWLIKRKPSVRFFFYTVVPDADGGIEAIRLKVDPDNILFEDKIDNRTWGKNFVKIVSSHLSNITK